jgi:hypothetical protein
MKENSKVHTTNYYDTFIEAAPDYEPGTFQVPITKNDKKTVAVLQYEMLAKNPYQFTSDDVLFQLRADKNDFTKAEYKDARAAFFSKGQACLRASPLTKKYGFGIHANAEGKIALAGMGTKEYDRFMNDDNIKKVKAMRSSKK